MIQTLVKVFHQLSVYFQFLYFTSDRSHVLHTWLLIIQGIIMRFKHYLWHGFCAVSFVYVILRITTMRPFVHIHHPYSISLLLL